MKFLLFVLSFSLSIAVYAQNGIISNEAVNASTRAVNFRPGTGIKTIPMSKGKTRGDGYMHEGWKKMVLDLRNSKDPVNVSQAKINLFKEQIEVFHKGTVYALNELEVKSITLVNSEGTEVEKNTKFYFCKKSYLPGLGGLCQIVYDDKIKLIRRYSTYLKRSTYVNSLDFGDNYDKIIKKEDLYLSNDQFKYQKIKSKKDILTFLGDKQKGIKQFIKNEKINVKSELDLIRVIEHYKTL